MKKATLIYVNLSIICCWLLNIPLSRFTWSKEARLIKMCLSLRSMIIQITCEWFQFPLTDYFQACDILFKTPQLQMHTDHGLKMSQNKFKTVIRIGRQNLRWQNSFYHQCSVKQWFIWSNHSCFSTVKSSEIDITCVLFVGTICVLWLNDSNTKSSIHEKTSMKIKIHFSYLYFGINNSP